MDEKMNSIAIVAIVGMVVFGIIVASGLSATGFAVKESRAQVCDVYVDNCMQEICAIQACLRGEVWCSTSCSCIPEGSHCPVYREANCQQCCALSFACGMQSGGIPVKERAIFNDCMDSCNVGGSGSCSKYNTCNDCGLAGCCWSNGECRSQNSGYLCEACVIVSDDILR